MSDKDRFEEEFNEVFDDYTLSGPPENDPEGLEDFLRGVAGDRLATPRFGYLEKVVLLTENGVGVYECCDYQIDEHFRINDAGEWTYEATIYYWLRHPGGLLGIAGRWAEQELEPLNG